VPKARVLPKNGASRTWQPSTHDRPREFLSADHL